jgi:hypothetical protein
MNFLIPDAAPSDKVNHILWSLEKGWKSPYPKRKQAIFAPFVVETDDDDRGRKSQEGRFARAGVIRP